MMIQSRYGTMLNTDHIESYKRSRSRFPYFTVITASGKEYLVHPTEMRKAYPDAE